MCGLCGLFGGGEDWTTALAAPDTVEGRTRRAERAERVRLANRILGPAGMSLDDWQGTSFIVRNATGSSEMGDTISEVWRVAARMRGRPIDPLDPSVLVRLAQGAT